MASGVKCSDEVKTRYDKLYKKKESSFCVFRLTENMTEIVVDKDIDDASDPMISYKDLCDKVSATGEPRYIVYDVNYELPNNAGKRRKILFVSWSSDDTAKVKAKMVYASSRTEIMKKLEGVQDAVQANDLTDLYNAEDEFKAKQVSKGK